MSAAAERINRALHRVIASVGTEREGDARAEMHAVIRSARRDELSRIRRVTNRIRAIALNARADALLRKVRG